MTLQEASIRFQINVEKLRYYEKNGLLKSRHVINGVPDYIEAELRKAGLIHSLMKAGFDIEMPVKRWAGCLVLTRKK